MQAEQFDKRSLRLNRLHAPTHRQQSHFCGKMQNDPPHRSRPCILTLEITVKKILDLQLVFTGCILTKHRNFVVARARGTLCKHQAATSR